MSFFMDIFSYFSPVFTNYVLPFVGVAIIIYVIYLIQFIIWGKN